MNQNIDSPRNVTSRSYVGTLDWTQGLSEHCMTLPKKTLLLLGLAFISLFGVLYNASATILWRSVRQAEQEYTRQAVEGVLSLLAQTEDDFNSRFSDWSAWDDTYDFIKDANKNYIASNLNPQTLANLKVNLVLLIQPSGKIVFGTGFDLRQRRNTSIPPALRSHLYTNDLLLKHVSPKSSLTGILLLPEKAMLVTSQPILTSEGKGPIRGTLIVGRTLDAQAIKKLSNMARLSLSIYQLNQKRMPSDIQAVRYSLSAQNSIILRPLNEQIIAGYVLLSDIYGKPALILRVDVPREIYKQGQNNRRYLITFVLMVGLIFSVVLLLLLQQLIVFFQQRQQAEAALSESEQRYALVVQGTNDGIWDWNLKINVVYFSPRWKAMLGFGESEIGSSIEEWYSRVHASDIVLLKQKVIDYLEGRTANFENEYRIAHKNGTYLWVISRGFVLKDADGKAYRLAGSLTDITNRKQAEEKLLYYAFHDALTGLANRALFINQLEQTIKLAKRHEDYLFAVLFLDLDRFKMINDSLGHLVGDQLLIALAQRLKSCLRSSDTFARLGGDEFVILLENIHSTNEGLLVAERIQQQLNLPFNLDGREVFITASIGVILSTTGYTRPEELLRDADTAMYKAKAVSRGCYQVFDITMHSQAMELLQLHTDLQRAILNQEFQLYYQPIVSLVNNTITGFEALVRWQHPERGLLSPAEFIPLAEETGLIIPLGLWVLREACCAIHSWQVEFPTNPPLFISVNVSGKQLSQPNLVEQLKQILQESKIDAKSLKLELTESVLMENLEMAEALLIQLHSLGIGLSIDDFGTGYSSLSYLHRFRFDTLKIDRSFIHNMDVNVEKSQIIRTIIALAWNLGMDAVAEGIETKTQLSQLQSLKCEFGQGYLFSKPLHKEGIEALLAQFSPLCHSLIDYA